MLFKADLETGATFHVWSQFLVPAYLFAAARKNRFAVPIVKLLGGTRKDRRRVLIESIKIWRRFGIDERMYPSDYIRYIAMQMNLTDEVRDLAIRMADESQQQNDPPHILAAASVWLASSKLGLPVPKARILSATGIS